MGWRAVGSSAPGRWAVGMEDWAGALLVAPTLGRETQSSTGLGA